ncbi:MAG: DUF2249 domain-containing protein [Proteobacteria bacterium]|nr:DUF2249 domain-containing protein [Pseudomonadota bacterium]
MSDTIHLDVCGMEPPEPLERTLDALNQLAPAQKLHILIDREPKPLYRILENNGYAYQATARPDYLYEILIWKK